MVVNTRETDEIISFRALHQDSVWKNSTFLLYFYHMVLIKVLYSSTTSITMFVNMLCSSMFIECVFHSQARVFGAGYPSLPTMTVDDWYEQHRKHGALPDQGIARKVVVDEDTDAKEREEEEKEKKAENDDEESLLKARNWDDWKDSHRRGYGNRHNMG